VARTKGIAGKVTPANATVIGRLRKSESIEAPRRVFDCPGCGLKWVIEPEEGLHQTEGGGMPPLHFDFKCVGGCDYEARIGLA